MNRKYVYIVFVLAVIVPTSCIKRLSRPDITGRVLDYNGNPIASCEIDDTKTDQNGYFHLPAITWNAFFLSEFMVMEAPPMMFGFTIKKEGYEDDEYEYFNKYGGGNSKNTKWNLGDFYLRKKDENLDINKVFVGNWKASFTKNADTLFLMNQKLNSKSLTRKGTEFLMLYDYNYSDYGKSASTKKVLPAGVGSREIKLKLQQKNLEINVLSSYMIYNKKDDSLRCSGTWEMAKDSVMNFKTSYKNLNGNFKILKSDLMFLQLKKL